MSSLLDVDRLAVSFPAGEGEIAVLRGVSFAVEPGEFVGLVGESGSGKSMTALAILRLLPPPGRITSGNVRLDGEDLGSLDEIELRRVRGGRVGMVFQEPMTALNPVLTVGYQIAEAVRAHGGVSKREAMAEAARLLDLVAIPQAADRLDDYPHQLSGGQRQRAMIAMALAAKPDLLIADEPTTALDVTIQAQILELLQQLRRDLGLAVLLITHDLAVVAETCDRALVMYAGRIVEQGEVSTLFENPAHPYTRGLLASVPSMASADVGADLPTIPGQIPDPARRPAGCPFHPRCGDVMPHCDDAEPALFEIGNGHQAACYLYDQAPGGAHATG